VTDYNATSAKTAESISAINQQTPKITVDAELTPDFEYFLRPGDRVSLFIDSPMLTGVNGNLVRIETIRYQFQDGIFRRFLLLDFTSPLARDGNTQLMEQIARIDERVDRLDKNYFNNT
jgi:hypothetical protein